jgi:hypothetical protein
MVIVLDALLGGGEGYRWRIVVHHAPRVAGWIISMLL